MNPRRGVGALVAISGVALLLGGCGNWISETEHVGRVGVRLGPDDAPVVVVEPCRSGTVQVDIAEGRTPDKAADEPNAQVGTWTARESADQRSELNLADPGEEWTGDAVSAPVDDVSWIVSATFDGEDATTMPGPFFSGADLAGLGPDQVLVEDGRAVSLADFDGGCS